MNVHIKDRRNAVIENAIQSIADGEILIPKDDFKYYDERVIATGIANICRLCKECNDNHNENCVIALTRRALELSSTWVGAFNEKG